jgi:hypothetical protein
VTIPGHLTLYRQRLAPPEPNRLEPNGKMLERQVVAEAYLPALRFSVASLSFVNSSCSLSNSSSERLSKLTK